MKIRAGFILVIFTIFTNLLNAEIMQKVEHGYVNNEGVKIHYVTIGKGPLVVMLHGFPDYWYTWRNQMEVLSEQYQMVAIDLRGYNKSDKPKGLENYTMRKLIGDVAAVINYFPQDKAVVIGHDWGGAIAWQTAMWHPNLVDKLVVLSTPHPNGFFREIKNNPDQQNNSQYARGFQKKDAYKELTAEELAEWVKDKEAKKQYIEAFNNSDFEAMLNYYKASFPSLNSQSTTKSQTSNNTRRTKKVKCPTLGIFGLEDKALLASGWNGTWDWIDNNLTLVSIPGAGHFVQQDNPEDVTNSIKAWLNSSATNDKSNTKVGKDVIKPFDKLIGTWEIKQSIRNQDGTWEEKTEKHKWKFYTILNGEAIQDDWITVESEGKEFTTGTNIRIFNSEENQWYMAWIDKTNRRTAVFTAKNENGNVIMEGANPTGRQVRNTFYNISENNFNWKQEWTFDNGQNWVEVVRIKGSK